MGTPRFIDFYDPDDERKLLELGIAANQAEQQRGAGPQLLGDNDDYAAAVAAYNEHAEQMEARRIRVYIKHLPRAEWRKLLREHPARPGVEEDKELNVNSDTVPDLLVPLSIDRERSENLPEDLDGWLASLSWAEFYGGDNPTRGLFTQAWRANLGSAVLADPTQRLAYASRQTSDATSN